MSLADSRASVPVSVATTNDQYVIGNGLIELTVNRGNGEILSLKDLSTPEKPDIGLPGGTMYWDANAEVANPPADAKLVKKGYFRLGGGPDFAKLVASTPDRAEIACAGGPAAMFAFQVEYHYVVLRGTSGFYAYVVFKRTEQEPAGKLWQTRFVLRTMTDDTFDHWSVGAGIYVPIPKAKVLAKVTDATYRLADGTVKTKYLNSVYWAQSPVYGVLGTRPDHGVGLWMIEASPEYHNGGPVKQGQTVHDNVLLRVLQSVHFGASSLDFAEGETWQKVYGPFLVYLNHGPDAKALWADADHRQKEEAAKWPYDWVQSPQYVKQRGSVTGKLNVRGGSARGAWVILAQPGSPWTEQGKAYQFWTRAAADGSFTIPKVVPGSYTLYVSGADQPEDFSHDGVKVTADQSTDVGTLDWQPVTHGEKIWQIGTFDRSAAEFRNGDDARGYQMFNLYPKQFPNDVNFTIGTSDIRKDWNYAQWTWYSKDPLWHIRFTMPAVKPGAATLTLGFASAQPGHGKTTDLRVAVNGQEVSAIHLRKTGTAGYRGGTQDSPYNVRYVTFGTSLLHEGQNEITLGHHNAAPFPTTTTAAPENENDDADAPPGTRGPGQVMYDALRLELQPSLQTMDPRFTIGKLLLADNFDHGLDNWSSELESGGTVTTDQGALDIDVPGGATVWLKTALKGPLMIQYDATVIKAGGPNDRASDLNCFWMSRDKRNPGDLFSVARSGKFAEYNQLLTYYVGLGGNGNTTTRFRRYIGDPVQRPLRPEDDLRDPADLITPNATQLIQLVACGSTVQFYRDGQRLFDFKDDQPYISGWFGFRTVNNHMRIRNFRVFELVPATTSGDATTKP
jgi:rhamnogalacturonan endolyase